MESAADRNLTLSSKALSTRVPYTEFVLGQDTSQYGIPNRIHDRSEEIVDRQLLPGYTFAAQVGAVSDEHAEHRSSSAPPEFAGTGYEASDRLSSLEVELGQPSVAFEPAMTATNTLRSRNRSLRKLDVADDDDYPAPNRPLSPVKPKPACTSCGTTTEPHKSSTVPIVGVVAFVVAAGLLVTALRT